MIILILILEDIQIKKYQEVQELNIVNQEYKWAKHKELHNYLLYMKQQILLDHYIMIKC